MVKGSLASVAKMQNISLAQAFLGAKLAVLLDTSASMMTPDAPGRQERYRAACNQLAKLQTEHPGAVVVVSFSSQAEFAPNGIPRFQKQGTDLAGALRFVRELDGLVKFVVISDGQPDDEQAALTAARQFKSQISTIYIGPERDLMAQGFLLALANAAGGTFAQHNATGIHLLSETTAKLLAA